MAAAHLQGKDFTSLDSLFTGIRKVLCKENIPAKALVYFQKRIQHEGESLILYCREKIHLFELSFRGEEYKTSRLLCNSFFEGILSVEVKKQLITQNPKGIPTDVEALLQAAIEAESVLERLSSIDKGEKKALKLTNETSMDMSMVQDQACGAMRGKSPRRGHVFNYSRPRKAQFPNPQAGYNFHRRGQQQFERSRYQQTSQRFTKLDLINEEGTMPTTTTPEGQAEAISAEETEEEVGKEVVDKAKLEIKEAASNVMILLTGPKIAPTEMSMPLKKLRKKKKKTWMKSSTTFPLPKLKKNQAIWDSSGPCSKTMKLSIQKTS